MATLLVSQAASLPLYPTYSSAVVGGQQFLVLGAQVGAAGEQGVLRHQVILDLLAVDQDRLGVLVGVRGPPVRAAAEHLLPEQDDEDQQQLGNIAEEQQERVRIRVEAQHSL